MKSSDIAPLPNALLNRRSSTGFIAAPQSVSPSPSTQTHSAEELKVQRRTGVHALGHAQAWDLTRVLTGQDDLLDGTTLEDDLGDFIVSHFILYLGRYTCSY